MFLVVGFPGLGVANLAVVGAAMQGAVLEDAAGQRSRAADDVAVRRVAILLVVVVGLLWRKILSGTSQRDITSRSNRTAVQRAGSGSQCDAGRIPPSSSGPDGV